VRRAVIAVVGTIVGLYSLLSYKSGSAPSRVPLGNASAPAPRPSTTVPASVAPTTSTTSGPKVIDGADVPNRFGDVQVELVVQRGRIIDVRALRLPDDRPRSARISDVAGPRLRLEVLRAQSARIDLVSGATYTSQSYAQSVQSALDATRG
jgi:uncharacterized protein with FMN-binding domain